MISASLLLALALASPEAAAATTPRIKNIRIRQTSDTAGPRIVVIVKHDDYDGVDSVETKTASGGKLDAEIEDVRRPLSGALAALPAAEATASLALTDADGATMTTLTGTLDASGSLQLSAPTDRGDGGDCQARAGCGDAVGAGGSAPDLDARAAWVVETDGGDAVSLVLDGAAAADVTGAVLDLTEVVEGEPECLRVDADGACLRWGAVSTSETTTTRLTVGDPEWVWGAALPADFEPGDKVKVTLQDADGDPLDRLSLEGALPLADGAGGTPALLVDDGPLATLQLSLLDDGTAAGAAGVSLFSSWNASDDPPEAAILTLEDGEVWTLTPHSYQASAWVPVDFSGDPSREAFSVEQDGVDAGTFDAILTCEAGSTSGRSACGQLLQDDTGQWGLSWTVFAADPDDLPARATLSLSPTRGEVTPLDETHAAVFDADRGVTFGLPVSLADAPNGAELVVDVEILGAAPGSSAVRRTLSAATLGLVLDTDALGALVVGGMDPGDVTQGRGDILIGGEPIGIEREVGGTPVTTVPPVIQAMAAGGGGKTLLSLGNAVGVSQVEDN
jgi:hypothetical protein